MKIWGLLFLFFSLQAGAADTYTLANKLSGDTKDFEALDAVLALPSSQQSIEGFLGEWKKAKPDFYSHWVGAYRSRSLQQADRLNPRIIMFNKNADMVMSFNGHPEYRGYSQVEMMRFNHSKNSFEFYEIAFENGRAVRSDANPRKCLECHQGANRSGVDPRPNWEPYSVWLGFFGSLDDATDLFKNSFSRHRLYQPETDAILLKDFDSETQWFEEFLYDVVPQHPRYVYLEKPDNENYSSEKTLNGDLTNRLATLNFRRVARLMKESSSVYEKVKWTVYGYAQCGQQFFVDRDVFDWLQKITPRKELVREDPVVSTLPFHCPLVMKDDCGTIVSEVLKTPTFPKAENSDVINLMFEPFGIDTEDWSMDFKTEGRLAFRERFGLTNDPRPAFSVAIQRVFGDDPDLKDLSCDDLKKRSLAQFGSLEKAKALYQELQAVAPVPPVKKPLIDRCISCHVNNVTANVPPLPFNDPVALSALLKKPGYKRGTLMDEILYRTGPHAIESEQMPPRGIPTIGDRTALIDYLKAL